MKLVRIGLGLFVIVYGLFLLIPFTEGVMIKLDFTEWIRPQRMRLAPIWAAMPVWELFVWLLGSVLMIAAGVQTIRVRRGFWLFVWALGVVTGLWAIYRELPEYQHAITPGELEAVYDTLAVMLLVGAAIWWVERPADQDRG